MSNVEHEIIITGVPSFPPGALPTPRLRLPIEELIKDKRQFSLYVQATERMMNEKFTNQLSWFAVGGIHGAPALPWDNVTGLDNPTWAGYCTHRSVLFPTWHRPYVLLYEQALVKYAVEIAEQYKGADAEEWLYAAHTLRSPYWDWAISAIPPPEVIEYPKLKITKATGEAEIDNPLLSYRYRDGEPPVDKKPATVRCPTPDNPNETNLESLKESLRRDLENEDSPMRERVERALIEMDTWDRFSNTRTSKGEYINSLEGVHNTLHVACGGAGQMADASVAAFDPLFWLHHTNVDRLLSLWQALHYDTWVSQVTGDGEGGTFTIPRNAHVNQDTALTPFWNGQSTFFKSSSDGVRTWEKANYNYPEFQDIMGKSREEIRDAIDAKVRSLYGSDETTPFEAALAEPAGGSSLRALAQTGAEAAQNILAAAPTSSNEKTRTDWFVRIRSKPASVGQSYSVLLFLGTPPASEHDYRGADNFVGEQCEFVNPDPSKCSNCLVNADLVTEGFVELTRALKRRGMYEKPEEEIEAYLRDNLHWRLQKIDATVIEPGEVAGLEIAVMTVPLEYAEHKRRWMKPQDIRPSHRNLTYHRPGGRARPQ